jgi:2'-5' RNA ligase
MYTYFITADLTPLHEPVWLPAFREKYTTFGNHLTLKYPTLVEPNELDEVTKIVSKLAAECAPLDIEFTKPCNNVTKGNAFIMISGDSGTTLHGLQKQILDATKVNGRLVHEFYRSFENNFVPHITIGSNLTLDTFATAWAEVLSFDSIQCSYRIASVTLNIIESDHAEKSSSVNKKTFPFDLA